METWREMSLNSLKAAKQLLIAECFRSSISCSYYAAYCAVTGELAGKYTFGYGGNNPTHGDLPTYVVFNLTALSMKTRQEIRKALSRLRAARQEADYLPTAFVDRSIALNAWRDANFVVDALEINNE